MKLAISVFRDICENLGRFADIRESAKEPRDRILVQARDGLLRFVAGNEHGTIVADAGPSSDTQRRVVSSRMLLSAAKTLKGKGSVEFEFLPGKFRITTDTKQRLDLPSISDQVPEFLRLAPLDTPGHDFERGWIPDAVRLLTVATGDYGSFEYVWLQDNWLVASDNHKIVRVPLKVSTDETLLIHKDFVSGLRGFDSTGKLRWNDDYFEVALPGMRAYTRAVRHHKELPPVATVPDWEEGESLFDVERRPLIDNIRAVMGDDEYGRVRMEFGSGGNGLLSVRALRGNAEVLMPANNHLDGSQYVDLDGNETQKLLKVLPDKELTFIRTPKKLVRVQGSDSVCLIAPIVL